MVFAAQGDPRLNLAVEVCACNRTIDVEPYFGILLTGDQDPDAMVYFHPEHVICMAEWDVAVDFDSPLGIGHLHSETIRRRGFET